MPEKPFLEAVRILAAAAWADGQIGEEEARMVRSMIDVGPLDSDEKARAKAWLHTRPSDTISTVNKLNKDARMDIYRSAARVSQSDGRTVRQERRFLANLAELLKIEEDTAKEVRKTVREEMSKKTPVFAKLYRLPVYTIHHELTSLSNFRGKALLIVNVASECGMTPQYEQLQALHAQYEDRGFSVIGFPCNQFAEQEPGTAEEILEFCTTTYGVTFPMMDKIEVKGEKQHDIYALLSEIPADDGEAGEVTWNFEKFVVSHDGDTCKRFRPQTKPDDPTVIAAIEAALPPTE